MARYTDPDPELIPHGTTGGYTNYGCRCDGCRAANAAYQRRLRDRYSRVPFAEVPHGTVHGYDTYRCRCPECRAAKAGSRRERAR